MSPMRFGFRKLPYLCVGLVFACADCGGATSDDHRSSSRDGVTLSGGDGGASDVDMAVTTPHSYDGGSWGAVTTLDPTGSADEPAVAMDDDASAIILWSQAADAKTDRRIWMRGYTPAGFTAGRILREHAKTPAIALAGHGYGVWSALQQIWPMSDSPYDSLTADLFHVGTGVTMTGTSEAVWGLKAPYEKSFSAPYAAINATGAGVFEYWLTDTVSTTKWTRPFQLDTTPGAYWQTAAASKSRGWAVLDGLGTLSSAWNEDSGHARYTMVSGMGGSQTPRIQNADTLLRVTPPKYRTTPGGLGVLGWSRPASTSAIEVVANRWAPAAVIGIPDRITVLPSGQSVVGQDVAMDRSGNAYAAWLERSGTETVLKASRAPAGGAWEAAVELRRNARIGVVHLGTDGNGDAIIVWDELDVSDKLTSRGK